VTLEGKQTSARNSLRHGMLARTVVLDGESEDRFLALVEALTAEHQPLTESEVALVENMAVARWFQLRVWGIHKTDFQREMDSHDSVGPPSVRAALAFRHLSDHSRSLDLAHRYATGFDRQFLRYLKTLRELQENRRDSGFILYHPAETGGATWDDENQNLPNEPSHKNEHPAATQSGQGGPDESGEGKFQ